MALTIQYNPPAYASFQDDLVYTVLDAAKVSDPVTYPNFKYIGDVYVGGVQVARIKKIPDPVTGIGIFNVAQIVRAYIAMTFNPTASILVAQEAGDGAFRLSVQMKMGYSYGTTDYINVVTDSSRIFFNNYNQRLIGVSSSIAAFADKIASDQPLSGNVLYSSANFFIPYFPTSTTPVPVVVTPTGGGIGYSTTFTPSAAFNMIMLNIAPGALNSINPGTITANTKSYNVDIGGYTFSINIICESQYTPRMVHFMNQYGGFESKLFTKVSRSSFEITRSNYSKLPYVVDASGNVTFKNSNGVYNEQRPVYASNYKEKLELNSDLLTDAEYGWLSDLLISTMVFIEDGLYYYQLVITDNNYEVRKNVNDDLTNLMIKAEYANQLNGQYR